MGLGPLFEGAIIRGRYMSGHARQHCAVSCAKMAEPLICCLSCGLWWAEGSTSSIVFARWLQCTLMGGHIGVAWQIRLNRTSAAAMRPSCQSALTTCFHVRTT